jgi:hypothetical protein
VKRLPDLGWPLWVWFALAWLAWAVSVEGRVREPTESVRARIDALLAREARERRTLRPESLSAREWRLIEGVGETRARALVRHRWAHAADAGAWPWMEAEGIGPVTEARIRAWFGARGVALDGVDRAARPGDALASRAPEQSVDSAASR